MGTNVVLLTYLSAFLLAVFLLFWFGKAKWYWHALSFACAIGIGVMPPMGKWSGPGYDMTIGSAFIILLIWGLGEPIYDGLRLPHHTAHHKNS